MLADSGAAALLTQRTLRAEAIAIGTAVPVMCIDGVAELEDIAACSTTPPSGRASPDDPAYVIYTSGSTGLPKGVQVGHRSVANFLQAMQQALDLQAGQTLVAVTTISFDIAVLELFLPLVTGARVVIAGRDAASDGHQLDQLLRSTRATCMQATPILWKLLLDAGWQPQAPFTAICGGEALRPELAAALLARGVTLWNAYGPTETTVWSTLHHVTRVLPSQRVSIGRPIANTRVYVVDSRGQPVPVGVWGELLIGGDGLAHGYLHRPELTEERFVEDPFESARGARLYRTGDIGRWLPDGTLDVLGRSDQQIKIRGHRVELGEVEALLREHPDVEDACVALREDDAGEPMLVAYVSASMGATMARGAPRELRDFLRKRAPEFMVPSAVVWLDALPRTANGKLDRGALPAPPGAPQVEPAEGPRDAIEQTLMEAWEELLGVPVGVHDNFFDLGGHSLLAIRLVSLLRERHTWHVPLATLLRVGPWPTWPPTCANVLNSRVGGRWLRFRLRRAPGRCSWSTARLATCWILRKSCARSDQSTRCTGCARVGSMESRSRCTRWNPWPARTSKKSARCNPTARIACSDGLPVAVSRTKWQGNSKRQVSRLSSLPFWIINRLAVRSFPEHSSR